MPIAKPFTLQSPMDTNAYSALDRFLGSLANAVVVPGVRLAPLSYKGDGKKKRRIDIGFFPSLTFIQRIGLTGTTAMLISLVAGNVAGATNGILSVESDHIIIGDGDNVNAFGWTYNIVAIGLLG